MEETQLLGETAHVELAEPMSTTGVEGRELATHGEGIYSLTFKTNDLERARNFLSAKGHRPESEGPDTIVLDADQAFGMRLGFTRRALPNDPRPVP